MFTRPLDRLVNQVLQRLTRETGLPQTEYTLGECARAAVGRAAPPEAVAGSLRRLVGSGQVAVHPMYVSTGRVEQEPSLEVRRLAVVLARHRGSCCFSATLGGLDGQAADSGVEGGMYLRGTPECCEAQERYLAAAAVALRMLG